MGSLRETAGGRLDLPTGAIYRALHRLAAAGLISGSWSVVGGRRRRVCQVTDVGAHALAGGRADWRDFAATITAVLEGRLCPGPA